MLPSVARLFIGIGDKGEGRGECYWYITRYMQPMGLPFWGLFEMAASTQCSSSIAYYCFTLNCFLQRFVCVPRGPTLTFKIHEVLLKKCTFYDQHSLYGTLTWGSLHTTNAITTYCTSVFTVHNYQLTHWLLWSIENQRTWPRENNTSYKLKLHSILPKLGLNSARP